MFNFQGIKHSIMERVRQSGENEKFVDVEIHVHDRSPSLPDFIFSVKKKKTEHPKDMCMSVFNKVGAQFSYLSSRFYYNLTHHLTTI